MQISATIQLLLWYDVNFARWKKFREQSPSNPIVSLAEVTPSTENLVPRPTLSRTRNVLAAIKKRVSSHIYANPNECDSRSVSIEYFEEYAKQASDNGVLLSQFLVLKIIPKTHRLIQEWFQQRS